MESRPPRRTLLTLGAAGLASASAHGAAGGAAELWERLAPMLATDVARGLPEPLPEAVDHVVGSLDPPGLVVIRANRSGLPVQARDLQSLPVAALYCLGMPPRLKETLGDGPCYRLVIDDGQPPKLALVDLVSGKRTELPVVARDDAQNAALIPIVRGRRGLLSIGCRYYYAGQAGVFTNPYFHVIGGE